MHNVVFQGSLNPFLILYYLTILLITIQLECTYNVLVYIGDTEVKYIVEDVGVFNLSTYNKGFSLFGLLYIIYNKMWPGKIIKVKLWAKVVN